MLNFGHILTVFAQKSKFITFLSISKLELASSSELFWNNVPGGGFSTRRITGPHLFCFGAPFVAKIISGGRNLSGALIIFSYTDFGGSVGVVFGNYGINL